MEHPPKAWGVARLVAWVALMGVFIWLSARVAEQDRQIAGMRDALTTMEQRHEYLPNLIRTEIMGHEARMKLWIERRLSE